VRELVRATGFPNMKVLEFALDSRDSTGAAEYLPFRFGRNSVVYTGTHDNETVRGWTQNILPEELQQVKDYLDVRTGDPDEIVDKMVIMAHTSVADLSIIPLQDYLRLDNSARINHPSTQGTNWKWRVNKKDLSSALAGRIADLTAMYGRLPE
jgi:4-alpha-glucanotransferase